ncbi:hypothetical protein [Gymnodinialimonas hymeniacidonis]|uniref:hypothetical protein n=1 Tax=Gymnodinialimonas hymeniacidonis TaxID=3126508 RepID=UPI0034C601C6
MRWLVLAAAVTVWTPFAAAQTLNVQSGDHVGFTRLVIPIGVDRSWNIVERDSRTWDVELEPPVDGFNTANAFDLIQRTRLAALEDNTDLTLLLSCDCPISGFRHQDQYLVIDISDPPEDQDPQIEFDETTLADRELERARAAEALPNLASLLSGADRLPTLAASPPGHGQPAPAETIEAGNELPNPQIEEAAQIMAEQLARAAASGLLDASLGEPQTFADPVETHSVPDQETEESGAADEVPAAIEPDAAQEQIARPDNFPIRTHTSIDPRIVLDRPLSPQPSQGACSAEPFEARNWADTETFEQGLGELRLGLYDDRDDLIEEGAEALALYYLYHGFGAEARYWLMQLEAPSEDLLSAANLVDGSSEAGFSEVDSPADCSDGALLWHYLDGAVAADLSADDVAAIQRAYARLPTPLRDLLGPRLARALHLDRKEEAARNVRDIINRGGRVPEAELRMLDFDLGISAVESIAGTQDALTGMLTGNASDAVSTMAQALAFDRNVGVRPGPERLTAAEALLRENGSGPETDLLWQEVVLGHAALGSIDTALSMLGSTNREVSVFEETLTALIADRVAVEDTATLLVLAHSFGARWRPEGSDAGRAQVSAIALLREAGLYEAAQILRDVRRPLILPAQADDARSAIDPIVAAWNARDWDELSGTATGAHYEIATRMAARGNPPDASEETLRDLEVVVAAVADSQSLRQAINEILAHPSPE